MPSRYSPETYAKKYNVDTKSVTSMDVTPEDKRRAKDADMWRLIGDIAPTAGTVLGGGLGALGFLGGPALGTATTAAGMGLGQAAGQAVGAGAKGVAESQVGEQESEAENKENRRQEMIKILTMLAR